MMRLAAQAYRPSSAINAYGIGRWTTVRRPSEIVTHARQPESLRDRGQDGCEHARHLRMPSCPPGNSEAALAKLLWVASGSKPL